MKLRTFFGALALAAATLAAEQVGAQQTCPKPPLEEMRGEWALAVTWQPAFCETFNTKNRPLPKECPTAAKLETFTLHGLWPQWAEYCVSALPPEELAKNPHYLTEACDLKRDEMPALQLSADLRNRLAAVMPGAQSQLDRHEYFKHGTCAGMDPESYFSLAVDLTEKLNRTSLPGFLVKHAGTNVTKRQLCQAVGEALGPAAVAAVEADHKKIRDDAGQNRFYLTELRIWLKPANGKLDLAAENFVAVRSGARTLGPSRADALCDDNLDRHVYYIDRPGMGR